MNNDDNVYSLNKILAWQILSFFSLNHLVKTMVKNRRIHRQDRMYLLHFNYSLPKQMHYCRCLSYGIRRLILIIVFILIILISITIILTLIFIKKGKTTSSITTTNSADITKTTSSINIFTKTSSINIVPTTTTTTTTRGIIC
jgi:hypothetical protein